MRGVGYFRKGGPSEDLPREVTFDLRRGGGMFQAEGTAGRSLVLPSA